MTFLCIKYYGIQELTDFLNNNEVTVRELIIKSHDESKYNSFILSVSTSDAAKVNDPDFWPTGIYVRRWRDDQQRKNLQQVAGPTGGTNENTDVGATNE